MAKADFGTVKYVSKQMKARGLQKLRFYCQICMKQCRDENGFKLHSKSPSHLKNVEKSHNKDEDDYTKRFEEDFLRLLRLSHGEKKIEANKFYNEFIQDKHHIHMNATKFSSLTKFIQYLSKDGKIRVHGIEDLGADADMGQLFISYIDNSRENALRKEMLSEIDNSEKDEQDIKAKLLQRQIEQSRENLDEEEAEKQQELTAKPPTGKLSLSLQKHSIHKVSKKKTKTKNIFKQSSKN